MTLYKLRALVLVSGWFRIATSYGLDGPGMEFRWGPRLPAPDPEAHQASCTMGTGSLSRE